MGKGGEVAVTNEEFAKRVESVRTKLYKTALTYLGSESLALDAVDEAQLAVGVAAGRRPVGSCRTQPNLADMRLGGRHSRLVVAEPTRNRACPVRRGPDNTRHGRPPGTAVGTPADSAAPADPPGRVPVPSTAGRTGDGGIRSRHRCGGAAEPAEGIFRPAGLAGPGPAGHHPAHHGVTVGSLRTLPSAEGRSARRD